VTTIGLVCLTAGCAKILGFEEGVSGESAATGNSAGAGGAGASSGKSGGGGDGQGAQGGALGGNGQGGALGGNGQGGDGGNGGKATGDAVWAQRFGDASKQEPFGLAADTAGNVLLTGTFDGQLDFGGGPLKSDSCRDVFLAKRSGTGTHVWAKRFGGVGCNDGYAVATDNNDNIVLSGAFTNEIDFGGQTKEMSAGLTDCFLAKFNSAGDHVWSTSFGSAGSHQYADRLALDQMGQPAIAGRFGGSVNFGGKNLNSAGKNDIFVAKFDAGGTHLWSKSFGDVEDQIPTGLGADSGGAVVLAAYFYGAVNPGGGQVSSVGGADMLLVKYNSAGTFEWKKQFGDAKDQLPRALAVDKADNILVAGSFDGTVNFGGDDLISSGGDIFVVKFNAAGEHQWSKNFATVNTQKNTMAVGPDGSVTVLGAMFGTVDFGHGGISGGGSTPAMTVQVWAISAIEACGEAATDLMMFTSSSTTPCLRRNRPNEAQSIASVARETSEAPP